MTDWMKMLIGGAATSLLAFGVHALTGEKYLENLDENARAALSEAGVNGVDVHMQREPVLSRMAVLHGELEGDARTKAEDAVRSVNNVAGVRWAGEDDAAEAEGEGAEQSAAATCQAKIDEALDGRTINFRSGSAYMPPSSVEIAQAAADALKECDGAKITIEGHSSLGGSAAASDAMSLERANRVKSVMVDRGVEAARILTKSLGASQLKVEGSSAEANQANRRVEFVVEGAAKDTETATPEEKE